MHKNKSKMNLSSIFRFLSRSAALCMGLIAIAVSQPAAAVTFKQQSLLSSGNWVRVNVSETGIQQISYDQLRALGINPEKAVVYGTPTTEFLNNAFTDDMPDDLVPTYCEHTPEGKLLFYGEGPVHYDITFVNNVYSFSRRISTYTNYSTYFITDSAQAPEVQEAPFTASSTVFTTHTGLSYKENEQYNPRSVGAFLWDQPMTRSTLSTSIQIKDFARVGAPVLTSSGRTTYTYASLAQSFIATVNSIFTVKLTPPSGWSATNNSISNQIFAFSNRTVCDQGSYTAAFTPSLSDKELADYTFDYKVTPSPTSAIQGMAALDYNAMMYPRHNTIPASGQLTLHYLAGAKGDNVKIQGADTDMRVWDVTDLTNIRPHAVSAGTDGSASFALQSNFTLDAPASRFVAFNPSAELITPQIAGKVANQNLHATPTPDFLIITTDAFLPLAQELAQYHREYLGQDVAVFTQQQIFNEFSSGAPAAMGYRRFAKMLYDRNPAKFRNLLLYGAGQWDNRKLLSPLSFEALLTYQTESVTDLTYATAYVADTYFGMLSDDFSLSNIVYEPLKIGVGRIPASVYTDAQKVNNKIRKFLQTPLPVSVATRALMVSDGGDECEHFKQSEQACSLLIANRPELTINKAHRASYIGDGYADRAEEVIKHNLTSGVSLFGYSGHGSQSGFCWNKNHASATSYEHPPFVMLSTCDPYCFHLLANSMAETMLYKEDGGAIGLIGAMCSVYLPYNQYYNLSVLDAWTKAKAGQTFGDVICQAKESMLANYRNVSGTASIFTNALCYNYCGDPALPVPTTDFGIKIDKINGAAPTPQQVLPLVPVEIQGSVTLPNGNTNTNFNGTATLYLYEAPYHGATPIADGQKVPYTFEDSSNLLAQVGATVQNGKFKATIISPQPQLTGEASRLQIVAQADDQATASGIYNGLTLGITTPSTPGQADLPGPAITDITFDTPGYQATSMVSSNTKMIINIDAPAGLNSADSNIGYGLRVMLDGTTPVDRALINIASTDAGLYTATVSLRDLTPGHHDLSISVADNALKRADAATTINVGTAALAALSVDEDALPARENLTFQLQADTPLTGTHRLIIRDTARRTVFSQEVTFPYRWNLTDTAGEPLPEGFYTASATSSTGSAATPTTTPELPLTILH